MLLTRVKITRESSTNTPRYWTIGYVMIATVRLKMLKYRTK